MAITQRTATVAEVNSATSITGTRPADRQTGDLAVFVVAMTCSAASVTGPGGSWVTLVAPTQATATLTIAAYYQFDPAADPTATTSGSAGQMTALMQSFAGVDPVTPVDVAAVTSSTAGATTLACTGVTTATDGAMVLSTVAAGTTSRTLTVSGLTEIVQYSHSSTGRACGLAGDVQSAAGATGSKTWGNTDGVTLAYVGFVGALRRSTAVSGDATGTGSVVTAGATADGETMPVKGDATSTGAAVTAGATAAGSYGAVGGASGTGAVVTAGAAAAGVVTPPAFPEAPLQATVWLRIDGVWLDITAHTYGRSDTPIRISRGRTAEGARIERQTATLELDNRDGRFSPRNPVGPYYGKIGRNTQVKIDISEGGPYLAVPGGVLDRAYTPDAPALGITGDLDVRIDLYADDWVATSGDLIGKYAVTGDQRGWRLVTVSDGSGSFLSLGWSTDGTASTFTSATSNAYFPLDYAGRLAVRVTLDVDDGSGRWAAAFYVASTIDGPWRQLGDTVYGAATTSVFDGTAPLEVGSVEGGVVGGGGWDDPVPGRYYCAEVRDGIDGALVANPVFTDQSVDATTFFDDQGNPWTLAGTTSLSQTQTRFVGEVSEWPQEWDLSGQDAWVPITASGVVRRLGQGQSPVVSVLRRAIPALPHLVAYWPCEDGANAQSVAPGIAGVRPMVLTDTTDTGGTAPSFASSAAFKASAQLPTLNTGRLDAVVPAYTATGRTQVRFLIAVPSGGITDLTQIVKVYTSGTAAKWELIYGTVGGGAVQLNIYDRNDASLYSSAFIVFGLNGRGLQFHLGLTQSGSNIDWVISVVAPGTLGGAVGSGTLAGRTVGVVQRLTIGKHNDLGSTVIGHVTVEKTVDSIFDLFLQLNAWLGEPAGDRMLRLADENGEAMTFLGRAADTARMGYQTIATYLDLVTECADTDGGILYEPRDRLGLAYRTLRMVERQNPKITLSYPGHQMSELSPTEDDRTTRNLVVVTRRDGGAATAELTSGALSTAVPPAGIGKYDTSLTLSLAADVDAERQAYWRLHLGTVDEARYPTLRVNLASSWIAADQGLVREILDADVGDRLVVTGPPLWVPPEDITQLVQGYVERLGQYVHEITWNLAPESPYRVAVYDDGVSRYSSDGSTVDGAHDATTTSLVVATPAGPAWSHTDGDFDVLVGGERMTVTVVTGTTSPQSFTVVRSINGVVKAQSSGTVVELAEPYYYGL